MYKAYSIGKRDLKVSENFFFTQVEINKYYGFKVYNFCILLQLLKVLE